MKIAIIDDHPLVRNGLQMLLSTETEFQVIAEAGNIEDGVNVINEKKPELAMIDLRLGKESGLNIVKRLKVSKTECKFVILTSSVEENDFKKADELGVEGYILKEALPEEIIYAIKLIAKGRKYYDPNVIELITSQNEDQYKEKLTERETEVLEALGLGLSNKEIAKKLFITEFTVKKHIGNILSKLDMSDRTQAAIYINNKHLRN